jgi:hypothetical protein
LGTSEANKSSSLGEVCFSGINIDTVWIVDGRVIFNNTNNYGSILSAEFRGPEAHGTKTLNNNSLAIQSCCLKQGFLNERFIIQQGLSTVVKTKTSRFCSSVNTTLRNKLTG